VQLHKRIFCLSDNINATSRHEYIEKLQQPVISLPREPDLNLLKEITMNFSKTREIGRGSFGVVYKVC
jgi:hypothetical protein